MNIALPFLSVSSPASCDTMSLAISSYQRCANIFLPPCLNGRKLFRSVRCLSVSSKDTTLGPDGNPSQNSNSELKTQNPRTRKSKVAKKREKGPTGSFPMIIPKKPRRGRRSEAAAVEDFVRDSLEQTFASIKEQNPEILKGTESILKDRTDDNIGSDDSSDDEDEDTGDDKTKMVVEEDDPNWPLDADVGWGTRASEYFERYPIKNVIGEDGLQIDWEGEIDNALVREINCFEWERFAFHPSPLVVLVFERYNRASENWKVLKELEKAAEVYWKAKDRLPPRTVKLDINIEKDLAYALKVEECPQLLFLRGNRILYREKEMRTADELVQMIAHFYYNAKKPLCINDSALSPPF